MSWWKGGNEVSNSWHWRVEHDNGTGSTQSEINVIMTRDYLGQTLDCRVNSSGDYFLLLNYDLALLGISSISWFMKNAS